MAYTGDGSVWGGVGAVNQEQVANGVKHGPNNVTLVRYGESGAANDQTINQFHIKDCVLYIEHFTLVDDGFTYDSGLGNDLIAVAWLGNDPDETNPQNVTITGTPGLDVTWAGPSGSGSSGFLFLLCRPGTTKTPKA